jgi:thiol:disulfide interchange protein DsbC
MSVIRVLGGAVLGLAASVAFAADPDQAIRATLTKLQPDMPIEAIAESPMTGLYQVHLKGGRLLYASADGQFLMQGNLYQFKDGNAVNLTRQVESQGVAKVINETPLSEMVVFSPKEPAKAHITVFTDTDCGYCQKLHSEVPELNRRGIEVRYMAFPRQGLESHGYNTLVSVWCAKDRQAAMNQAKSRQELPAASCDNPVAKQYELGQMIGVNGTPAIVMGNGELIPGYQPAPELAKAALEAK